MSLNLFKKTSKILAGLEISPEGFSLVCLSSEKEKYSLKHAHTQVFFEEILRSGSITKPELFAETLRKVIEENNLSVKEINISVPASNMFIKTVSFPNLSEDELKIIAPQEAAKFLPLNANQINTDIHILKNTERDNKVNVILVALSKTIADNLTKTVSMAGVEVKSIDVSSFSMIRALANAESINDVELNYISVLMGYEDTDIHIVKNGVPVFSHNTQTGKKHIIETVMKGFEINREEANVRLPEFGLSLPTGDFPSNPDFSKANNLLKGYFGNIASEIQKAVEFYNSQSSEQIEIEKVILGGCGICIQNIDKYIANKLKINTELCESFKNISLETEFMEDIQIYAPSVGLALKK
jgi:type IV pilus assembly protein PilM